MCTLHTQHDSYVVFTVRAYSTRYELELHTRMSNAPITRRAATGRDRRDKTFNSTLYAVRSGGTGIDRRYDTGYLVAVDRV